METPGEGCPLREAEGGGVYRRYHVSNEGIRYIDHHQEDGNVEAYRVSNVEESRP